MLISSNLAGQNIAEGSERVVESLVVNELVQVLDEDIALSGLAEGRVTLGPHDAAVVSRASVGTLMSQKPRKTHQARFLIKE